MSGKKILWVSHHAPLGCQIKALQRRFGEDCQVVEVARRHLLNSNQVAREFAQGGYADLVCVVPLATLDHICRAELTPLWADMTEKPAAGARPPDLIFRGKPLWFVGYRRVMGVSLNLTAAQPKAADVRKVLRLTRHPMPPEERAALQALYPGAEVIDDGRLLAGGLEALDRFRRCGADDFLIVAPYSVIDQIVKAGVEPLWARVVEGQFQALFRVTGVQIDFEEV